MSKNIHAIIPAAGVHTNMILSHAHLPDAMMPINGKPVLGYIIEDLIDRNITSISVVLGKDDTYSEKYLNIKYGDKCNLKIIFNDKPELGPGYSLALGITKTQADSYIINLGDTIYKGPLKFNKDFLVVSKFTEQPHNWCFVSKKEGTLNYINKPKSPIANAKILVGIYFFCNGKKTRSIAKKIMDLKIFVEVSDILKKYQKSSPFTLVGASGWYDCGNIENYYKAKIDFLKLRSFNQITYNDTYGYITKTSKTRSHKISDEIAWYENIPEKLKIFTPRLIKGSTKHGYSMEYYGYPSLADQYIFESLDGHVWNSIIKRLFEIIALFISHGQHAHIPKASYENMFLHKTLERLEEIQKDAWWEKLLQLKTIRVNGKEYNNLPHYLPLLRSEVEKMHATKRSSILHGDLCLSNILFDPGSRVFKFIDPRGRFGHSNTVGDIRYDLAKLRHSFSGFYDFIIGDLFNVQYSNQEFTLSVYANGYHFDIASLFDEGLKKNNFSLRDVKLIEALLFLSMLPLHSNAFTRQQAMYIQGIKLLNDVYAHSD